MDALPAELRVLAWSVLLGLFQLVLAAAAMTRVRGLAWNAGPRDGPAKPLDGMAGRLDRAWRNFLETFAFFAAAVLAVVWADRADATSALGAHLYLWARVAYVPLYAFGVPYVRSLVWTVSVVGMLMVLGRLF